MPAPVTLLYWARTRAEFCFADELRALAARHAGFDVRFVLTGEMPAADDEAGGRIDAALLDAVVAAGCSEVSLDGLVQVNGQLAGPNN